MRIRILLVVGALITYGSLYPFHFAVPQSHAAAWHKLLFDWTPFTSRGDALGNLALFIPFGFAGVFSVPGRARAPGALAVLLVSFVLAAVLQIFQIYFPGRTPAMADVVWNMIGAGVGVFAGWWLSGHIRWRWQGWQDVHALPLALIALWVAAELLPFVPSLDLQAIKNSVKALMRLHVGLPDILWHAAGVLVAGRALKAICGPERAARVLAILLVVIIAGKVLVVTRVLNLSTVIGLIAGYGLWFLAWGSKRPPRGESVIPLILLAAYTVKALEPFQLQSVPADFHWIPFARMLQGAMMINTMVLVESIFAFAGVLGLIRMQGAGVGASTFVLAIWVGALEAVQMYLAGRTSDITEPLLVILVGLMVRYFGDPAPATRRRDTRYAGASRSRSRSKHS